MIIIAKSPIKHNHTLYQANELIEDISDEQAQSLIDSGVATEVKSKSEQKRVETVSKGKKNAKKEEVEEVETEETETEETTEDPMAGVKPSVTWAKTRLLGYARAKNIEVKEEMTRAEIYNAIKNVEGGEDDTSDLPEEAGSIGGAQPPASTSNEPHN